MSREIKFRAWDKRISAIVTAPLEITQYRDGSVGVSSLTGGDTEDFILMQFTGLYDYDRKEIYEGDIVSHTSFPDSEIVFSRGQFTPIYDRSSWDEWECDFWREAIQCTVIGNVYENPELLDD